MATAASAVGVGATVEALQNIDGVEKWFTGKVSAIDADGKYTVLFDDGDTDDSVPAHELRPLHLPVEAPPVAFAVGDSIEALLNEDGVDTWLEGKVTSIDQEGFYTVVFPDDEVIDRVPEHEVRPLPGQTPLEAALRLSYSPGVTRHRESEYAAITAFLNGRIEADAGGKIYICGGPGLGKTLHVDRAVEECKRRSEADEESEDEVPKSRKPKKSGEKKAPPEFVFLRGTVFRDDKDFLVAVATALSERGSYQKKAWVEWESVKSTFKTSATELLGDGISNAATKPAAWRTYPPNLVVVVIDEIDALVPFAAAALKRLFSIADAPKSRLVLVGIANAIDVPRHVSDLVCENIVFDPYNYEELVAILKQRVGPFDAFDERAMEYAARKVAATTGDARRVFEVCAKAFSLARQQSEEAAFSQQSLDSASSPRRPVVRVTIAHAAAAVRDIMGSSLSRKVEAMTFQAHLMLAAALKLSKASQNSCFTRGDLAAEYARHATGATRTATGQTGETFDEVAASGLIVAASTTSQDGAPALKRPRTSGAAAAKSQPFRLFFDAEDVVAAMRDVASSAALDAFR
ncbi:P-loop containing nucleoside triphosphate hydrolase protein [Pelagophyceae sp. CCMP2097]|nr:P-loop containing nucleoside triphosphate hydrolase protein [Pelagophyceae sp. CCMP2097]|mmetsp:Transcript_13204/g.45752  ORF Transcript_13204/g.45752 Transcript_13204/m.45752 type:complete len:576 (-) Transcript_13204:50-1777(-)